MGSLDNLYGEPMPPHLTCSICDQCILEKERFKRARRSDKVYCESCCFQITEDFGVYMSVMDLEVFRCSKKR
jgi:hypothetical protein